MNITLDEVRQAVANHNARTGTSAFIEADRGDYVIFNYVISFDGIFPFPNTDDPALNREYTVLRECRGLTFSKDGRILARKFAKFFNIGEKPESQIDVIDWSEPHHVLEKMDGSMINPMWTGAGPAQADGLVWCTKMGETDVAKPVNEWIKANPHYAEWAANMINHGWTPLFEWCSRKQKIVIDYPEDRLVLLALRDNLFGGYMPYDKMVRHAEKAGMEVVRALPGGVESIETFMAEVHDVQGMEGYIVRFHDGRMYKVKGLWYCQIHKTKDFLQHEKDVLAMIAHNTVDDVKPFMEENDRKAVEAYAADFAAAVEERAVQVKELYDSIRIDDQKEFAQYVNANLKQPEAQYMFLIKRGADPADLIRATIAKAVHPTAGTQARVDGIRDLIGGLDWRDYKYSSLGEE
jgi:RNA ligase